MDYKISVLEDANYHYDGYLKSKEGSDWKPEVQHFEANYLLEISHLQNEIKERTYKSSKPNYFVISERGRTRPIRGYRMRDRVVRHVYCDHVLNPVLRPKLIYDNYASLQDRGITMARKRFIVFLHKWFRKHGNNGAIMITDYSGFYDNILHDDVKNDVNPLLQTDTDIWFLSVMLSDSMIDVSFLSEEERSRIRTTKIKMLELYKIPKEKKTGEFFWGKSLNIGDQGSQSLSVFYPIKIDNFVKIVCSVKFYGRYMDDSFIIAETKEELLALLAKIKQVADSIGIFLNPKKTRIYKLNQHFRFLQLQYTLTSTGRIIVKINPKRLTAMRRKLKKLKAKVDAGEVPYADVKNMFKSWYGSFHVYLSKTQKKNLVFLYDILFRDYRKGVSIWTEINKMVSRWKKKNRCASTISKPNVTGKK